MGFFKRIVKFFKKREVKKTKTVIEGYLLQTDVPAKKSLILVKTSDSCWTAKWFDDSSSVYNSPLNQITHIFKPSLQ